MAQQIRNPSIAGSIASVALAAGLWLALGVALLAVVPRQKKVFDEYALQLPALTQVVIDVSTWFCDFWWVVTPVFAVAVAVAALITYFVRHRSNSRALAVVWLLFLFAVPLLAHALVWTSILLARAKLLEGLSR